MLLNLGFHITTDCTYNDTQFISNNFSEVSGTVKVFNYALHDYAIVVNLLSTSL